MRRRARGSDCLQSRSRAAEHSALRETPMTDPSDKMCKHWPYPANVFLLSFAYTSINHIAQYYVLHVVSFCRHGVHSRPLRSATWSAAVFIDARQSGRKNLLKLVLEPHATTSSPSARTGHGSGARNTKTARAGWRVSRPFGASQCW